MRPQYNDQLNPNRLRVHSDSEAYNTYLKLPTIFTEPHPADLEQIGSVLLRCHRPEQIYAGASALVEAAVGYGAQHFNTDTLIIRAQHGLQRATHEYEAKIASGSTELIGSLWRARMHERLIPVYGALAYGRITTDMQNTVANEQVQLIQEARTALDNATDPSGYTQVQLAGFLMELLAQRIVTLGNDHNEITLPAHVRGDHGAHEPNYTHDILHIRIDNDDEFDLIGFEIKSHATDEDRARWQQNGGKNRNKDIRLIDMAHVLAGTPPDEMLSIARDNPLDYSRTLQDCRDRILPPPKNLRRSQGGLAINAMV